MGPSSIALVMVINRPPPDSNDIFNYFNIHQTNMLTSCISQSSVAERIIQCWVLHKITTSGITRWFQIVSTHTESYTLPISPSHPDGSSSDVQVSYRSSALQLPKSSRTRHDEQLNPPGAPSPSPTSQLSPVEFQWLPPLIRPSVYSTRKQNSWISSP